MKTNQRGFIAQLLLIAVAILIGFGIYHYQQKAKESQATQTAAPTVTNTADTTVTGTTPSTVSSAKTPSTGSKDCGSDMNCFIAQAATCGPASVEFNATVFQGVTSSSHIVIGKSSTTGSCTFSKRTDKVTIQGKVDNAVSGTVEACPAIPSAKLGVILTNWNAGTFDSSDLDPYHCKATSPDGQTFNTSSTLNIGGDAPQSSLSSGVTTAPNLSVNSGGSEDHGDNRSYQYTVTAVTPTTLSMDISSAGASTSAVLTLNNPVTVFGHVFTLIKVVPSADASGQYSGTITVKY